MTVAFYSGSFDPLTLGHRDILRRSLMIFRHVVVGIGTNPTKTPLFSTEERVAMLREEAETSTQLGHVDVVTFEALAVKAAAEAGATVIVRGLRDGVDLAYEMQMAGMNAALSPSIQTVFLASSPGFAHITSTLVRQIAMFGGAVTPFVSPAVEARITSRRLAAQSV